MCKIWVKFKNCLFKMKIINQIILGKGLSAYVQEHLCLTKGQLDNPEKQMEVESPLTEYFWHFQFKLRTKLFWKRHFS